MNTINKALTLCFAFCACVLTPVFAGNGTGTSGGCILSQSKDARALGMADAYTAVKGNIASIHFNPASLAFLEKTQLALIYQRGIAQDSFGSIDMGFPSRFGTFSGSILYYNAGSMELISSLGTKSDVISEQDYIGTLSYSLSPIHNVGLGVNGKILKTTLIESFSSKTYALDLGGLVLMGPFALGAAVQNIGTKIKFIEEEDPLPLTVRSGLSFTSSKFILDIDCVKPNDDTLKEHLGIEYNINRVISLRTGYKIGYDLDSFTLGAGVTIQNIRLDYAIAMMGELNPKHHASINIYFSDNVSAKQQKTKKLSKKSANKKITAKNSTAARKHKL